jgi:hypothetical protein
LDSSQCPPQVWPYRCLKLTKILVLHFSSS